MKTGMIAMILLGMIIQMALGKKTTQLPTCKNNSDCLSNHICKEGHCYHKGFLPPNLSQLIEIFIMCGLSTIATVAGVGGGAIYSALLMFIENFEAQTAFPISSFSILICSVSTFCIGVRKKLANPKMKFIDYDLVIVFCPALLLGTKIGVICNSIFPALLLIIILILSLSFSSYKTYNNALKVQNRERQIAFNNIGGQTPPVDNNDNINQTKKDNNKVIELMTIDPQCLPKEYGYFKQENPAPIKSSPFKYDDEELTLFYQPNSPIYIHRVKWIIILQLCMFIDQLLEGNNKIDSIINISKCSLPFWGIFLFFIVFCLAFTKLIYKQIKQEEDDASAQRSSITPNDGFKITSPEAEEKIGRIVSLSFLAGVTSGMLGIGGGMFMAPLLLELNVNTKVATSTSNFILIFTSFSSTCLYGMAGNLVLSYALMYGILCGISSFLGSSMLTQFIERTNKQSVLIWMVLAISLMSLVLLPINAINHAIYDLKQGMSIFAFNSFCT